ncbi:MAG: deoxyribonuclease IV [Candidatus Doudnabacteria bacterium]|nr:deoxyribonuclease IV [Candidatus Doudnabacteria bacterium]
MKLFVGCHVSIAGGVFNAPKNARDLGCETFQIFTRSPQGGHAPELDGLAIEKFKIEMRKYHFEDFVVHCPYYINFGSSNPRVYHGSISVVRQELERSSLLGAKFTMTHLGSFKDLGKKDGMKQVKEGLKKVLDGYSGQSNFLIEIAAGAGEIIGDTFEELAEIMEPIKKHKGFGGICFDTQHAFASGYDLTTESAVSSTFKKFDKVIGLKWLKMSHINDSKEALGSHKDRHEHIGQGKIGEKGFESFLKTMFHVPCFELYDIPLILETKADKVKADIKILKTIRNKTLPG